MTPPSTTNGNPTAPVYEELWASVVALERFQIELRAAGDRDEVLQMAIKHLGQIVPIEVGGFYFPDSIGEFALQTALEPSSANRLSTLVEAAIDNGTFGWALRHPRPAPVKIKDATGTLVLGALRTNRRVLGMFAGVVDSSYLARWDVFAPIVGTYLSRLADSILSDELTTTLQENNRELDDLVRQRTQELEVMAAELAKSKKIISCAADVTRLLLAATDLNAALHRSVVHLGEGTRADRICFVLSSSPGIPGVTEHIQWLSGLVEADSTPDTLPDSWVASLRDGQTLVTRPGETTEAEQRWLDRRSIRSLLLIPIITEGIYWGYLRFDSCVKTREWSMNELGTLSTISSNMGLSFRRDLNARQLNAAKENAEIANRAKGRFLATISHELRTPLNAILGYTQSLIQNQSVQPKEVDQIKIIHGSAEHLLMLINDLLDLARADLSRIELAVAPVDIAQLGRDVARMAQLRAEEKGLAINCVVHPGTPKMLETDGRRLRQVLINLLGNAIKFTDQGSVTLDIQPRGGAVCFKVADTGCGIRPEEMRKLFQPFSQLGSAKQRAEGSGLGLAICKNILDVMGAKLEVHSEPGQGSEFWFELPVPASAEAPATVTIGSATEIAPASAGCLPDPERLQRFQKLVAAGDIIELQSEINLWITESSSPNPLAVKLLELAGAFRIKALRQILHAPAPNPNLTTQTNPK